MKNTIRKAAAYMRYFAGVNFISRKLGSKKTLILAYHRVDNLTKDFEYDSSLISVSKSNFEKQMNYLSKHYNVISLEDFMDCHKKKIDPPKNSVVITFDDGYLDSYTNAFPILKKYNLPATIYLTTGAVKDNNLFWWDKLAYILNKTKSDSISHKNLGNFSLKNKNKTFNEIKYKLKDMNEAKKNEIITQLSKTLKVNIPKEKMFLNWSQIKTMQKNHVSFGAHTVNHPILTNVSLKEAETEIEESKKTIESNLKTKVALFAYPNGHESDFNEDIIQILKKQKFSCSTTYIPGWADKNSNPYRLNRVFVKYADNLIMFKNKLTGLDIFFGKIYNAANKIRGKKR